MLEKVIGLRYSGRVGKGPPETRSYPNQTISMMAELPLREGQLFFFKQA
jgi:hypothetical protein